MTMIALALLVVLPTWWAMDIKLAAEGQGRLASKAKAAAFALFQLAVMAGLTVLDAWWATVLYAFLMLATGNMILEAASRRYPASRLGSWWARQKMAATKRN